MPATQRGQAYRLGPSRWGLRYYDVNGVRRRKSPFPSKSAALTHYREVIEPQLRGDPTPLPELTLAEFVPVYLERHSNVTRRASGHEQSRRSASACRTRSRRSVPCHSATWSE